MSFNIYESQENYLLTTFIPGINSGSLAISVEKNTLTIQAKRSVPEGKAVLKELPHAQFNKNIKLDQNIDYEKINAQYQDGLLTLTLPKRNKRIEIKVA